MMDLMEPSLEKETFGQYLRREREFRAISLEEISSVTRICMRHLSNLEADAFEELPAKAFVRGYIRAFSNHIGLDSDEVVLRYESAIAEQEDNTEEENNGFFSGIKKLLGRRKMSVPGMPQFEKIRN